MHTLIYPQEQDAGRAQSRPPGATMGGPVPNGPRSQARASSGPCPASLTALPLEADPRPSRAEVGKSLRLPRFQDFTQNQYLGTYPKIFQFSRIEFRWDFIPGRDHISVQLTLGLRKLPQASQSLQRARIREDVSLPCVCQTPQVGPIGCSPPHAPLEGSFHVWPWGSLDTHPRGLSHATPLGGCCVTGHDPSPAHAGGSCHP